MSGGSNSQLTVQFVTHWKQLTLSHTVLAMAHRAEAHLFGCFTTVLSKVDVRTGSGSVCQSLGRHALGYMGHVCACQLMSTAVGTSLSMRHVLLKCVSVWSRGRGASDEMPS